MQPPLQLGTRREKQPPASLQQAAPPMAPRPTSRELKPAATPPPPEAVLLGLMSSPPSRSACRNSILSDGGWGPGVGSGGAGSDGDTTPPPTGDGAPKETAEQDSSDVYCNPWIEGFEAADALIEACDAAGGWQAAAAGWRVSSPPDEEGWTETEISRIKSLLGGASKHPEATLSRGGGAAASAAHEAAARGDAQEAASPSRPDGEKVSRRTPAQHANAREPAAAIPVGRVASQGS